MTYTECRVCGFRGHGQEVRWHYQEVHVGHVNVTIIPNIEKDTMQLIIQGHIIETAIPVTKGALTEIQVNGSWRQHDED